MATKIEKVLGKIKKDGALVDAYFASKAKYVTLENGTTVEEKLGAVDSTIAALPTNADVNNAINAKISSAYKAGGSKANIAALPELSAAVEGFVYNIETAFTTTADFVEGAGKKHPAGTNVAVANVGTTETPVYKYDVLAGFVDLSGYVEKDGTKVLSDENFTTTLKNKLDGVDEGANNYTHPATHSADMITETTDKQFISAADKAALAARAQIFVSDTEPQNMRDGDIWFQTVEETVGE